MTSAIPVRCSTNWAMKPHVGSKVNLLSSYFSRAVKWCEILLKLENLLRWSLFTFIYNRSTNMNYFIYISHHFTAREKYELNKLTLLPTCGFIAQLVEHRTGIAEVMGSNPVEALIFFRLLLSNCLNWKIYCDDHSSHSSTTAVQIWIISYISHIISLHGKNMNSINWPCSQRVAS